jgi:hypothetical protein
MVRREERWQNCHSQSLASSTHLQIKLQHSNSLDILRAMSSNWHDSARALFAKSPELAGRILHDLLKADLPPVIEYTLLTPLCGDEPDTDEDRDDDAGDDLYGEDGLAGDQFDDSSGEPIPEMVILAGPASRPVRAVIVEFLQRRDDAVRRRWPLYAAAIWLFHGCPVDLLVICSDELTGHWADRPIATALDGYVCRPNVLLLEDLGTIFT